MDHAPMLHTCPPHMNQMTLAETDMDFKISLYSIHSLKGNKHYLKGKTPEQRAQPGEEGQQKISWKMLFGLQLDWSIQRLWWEQQYLADEEEAAKTAGFKVFRPSHDAYLSRRKASHFELGNCKSEEYSVRCPQYWQRHKCGGGRCEQQGALSLLSLQLWCLEAFLSTFAFCKLFESHDRFNQ